MVPPHESRSQHILTPSDLSIWAAFLTPANDARQHYKSIQITSSKTLEPVGKFITRQFSNNLSFLYCLHLVLALYTGMVTSRYKHAFEPLLSSLSKTGNSPSPNLKSPNQDKSPKPFGVCFTSISAVSLWDLFVCLFLTKKFKKKKNFKIFIWLHTS